MSALGKFQIRVRELMTKGLGPDAIQRKTGKDYGDVIDAIAAVGKWYLRQEGRDKRTCLRCREPFKSEWAGNRLCPKCRNFAGRAAVAMD